MKRGLVVLWLGLLGQVGFAAGLDEDRLRLVELVRSRVDIKMEEYLIRSAANYVVATSALLRPRIEASSLECELATLSGFEAKLNALLARAEGQEPGGAALLAGMMLEDGLHRDQRLAR